MSPTKWLKRCLSSLPVPEHVWPLVHFCLTHNGCVCVRVFNETISVEMCHFGVLYIKRSPKTFPVQRYSQKTCAFLSVGVEGALDLRKRVRWWPGRCDWSPLPMRGMPVSLQMCVLLNCCGQRARRSDHTGCRDRDQPTEPSRAEPDRAHRCAQQGSPKSAQK